jgi:hypothetical protein
MRQLLFLQAEPNLNPSYSENKMGPNPSSIPCVSVNRMEPVRFLKNLNKVFYETLAEILIYTVPI